MIKEFLNKNLLFVLLLVFIQSCTKDVDFSQADAIEANPVNQVSFLFFEAEAGDFFVAGNQPVALSDFINIDAFNNTFVDESLVMAEFEFETINSINRSYEIQMDFFDEAGTVVHTFSFLTPPSVNNQPLVTNHIEPFAENNNLNALKQTRSITFTLRLLPGQALSPTAPGTITLRSQGKFYFNIKNQE